jgi:catechol 2,3-dioxygenase-like lactoylglutathione lyase family enzyme
VSDHEVAGAEFEQLSGVFGDRVRIVDLKLGDEKIELTEYLTLGGRPMPLDSRSNDLWFQHIAIIVSDMDKAYTTLRSNKVRHASTGPQTLPSYITAAAGIKAFYFKDPDNHVLEILQFPDGKGLQKWHELSGSGTLFLGIDHTAIVVSNSDSSLKIYRDALGLSVAGTSDNYGPEQEHLNNVLGAKLHITGLRTKEPGIAVEFLEYTAPHGGRVYPSDSSSSDLWHWQTSFASSDVRSLSDLLARQFQSQRISAGVVELPKSVFGFSRSVLVRDPDGHAIRLQQ